jgi:hypothetical protein
VIAGAGRVAAIVAGVSLAGCGLSNPDDTARTPPAHPGSVAVAPSLRTTTAAVAAQTDAEVRIAVVYALTQATWSPDTYVSQQARLAALSTGQALAQLATRAGQPPAAVAAQLAAAGASSKAALIGADGPNPEHQVVVAYKTIATGAGRNTGQPEYAIARLTLTRRSKQWLVSSFAIQP